MTVTEHAALCDRGLRRADNQDRVLNRPPVFAVADGMGGARGGAAAAQMAVDALDQLVGDPCVRAPLGPAVQAVNREVHARAQHDPSLAGMGTTLTAMRVAETTLELAHVGDSRAYRLGSGALGRLTEDDSVVQQLVRRGKLTPEQAARHPLRSVITRAVGARSEIEVTTRTVVPHRDDLFLLCSDGLTTVLTDPDIAAVLRGSPTLLQAAGALVAAARRPRQRRGRALPCRRLPGHE